MFVLYVSLIWVITVFFEDRYDQRGVGGGGGGEGTGTPDFKWQGWSNGDKNKKKKVPGPKFNPPPPPQKKEKKSHLGIRRNYQESLHCSEYPKEFPTQIKVPKNYLLKFSSQNFKPKQSFNHSRHMKSGVALRAATYIIYQVSGGICSVNLTI